MSASVTVATLLMLGLFQDEPIPVDRSSSESCAACHPEVYAEWLGSGHARAYVNPVDRTVEMTDGFQKHDCVPCHAPRPVFEHGLGPASRVLARETNRFEGVDCLTCHLIPDGVAASRPGLRGPCNPIYREQLLSTNLCAPCHNQHNTIDEWKRSPAGLRGENCSDCHMPGVVRTRTSGGDARQDSGSPARTGRYHGPTGGNTPAMLKSAVRVSWKLDSSEQGAVLRVTITNSGAAHNLPTDAKHRALDLVVSLLDREGRLVGAPADAGAGQRGGSARLRFRNPYRTENDLDNTQIPAGESRTLALPLDLESVRSAEILLLYKRTPFMPDEEAVVVEQRSIVF